MGVQAELPGQGMTREAVIGRLKEMRHNDADWHSGRVWSLVYHVDDEHVRLLQEAYNLFFMENALNPLAFPSLQRCEQEVVAIAGRLLGGDGETTGTMTSGGTESLLLAVKTYRDRARALRPEVKAPEAVLPASAHPGLLKGMHYFGVTPVPVAADLRVDPAAMARAITPNTIMLVGSAPSYPHGVVDPIAALGEVALRHGIGLHVDACVGGFVLPFAAKLGYPIPPFDFRVPGVTSLSADLHKYGYAAKGASVILYKDQSWRNHQFFIAAGWSGGIYMSPGIGGTRPAGPIAAAWACLHGLGEAGYLRLTDAVMATAKKLQAGINAIPGLYVLGEPEGSIFAFASEGADLYALAEQMEQRGWHMDRQMLPPSLHLTVTPAHAAVADRFLADLAEAQAAVLANPALAQEGFAPVYGLMASLPDRGQVAEMVLNLLNGIY